MVLPYEPSSFFFLLPWQHPNIHPFIPWQVNAIRKGVTEGKDTSVCLLNYRADGTPFWNQFFVAPLRDLNGNVVYYVGAQCVIDKPLDEDDDDEEEEEETTASSAKQAKKSGVSVHDKWNTRTRAAFTSLLLCASTIYVLNRRRRRRRDFILWWTIRLDSE